jgi:transposase
MSTPPDPVPSLKAFAATTERLRQWRATHPTATLREIERETDRQLARVRADLVASVAQTGATAARPDCPHCGQPMRRVGVRQRTVTTTQEEHLHLAGARYRCSACGAELFPPG